MSIFSTILASLVALEALNIMQLEMFASKEKLENVFGLSKEYLSMEKARVSMKNQGLYNGFIGVGLLFSRFFFPVNSQFIGTTMFVIFVIIAAIYGWLSAKNIKILLLQGTPAILALLSLIIFK